MVSKRIFSFWIISWYFSSIFLNYRYVADEQNQKKLQINAQNCLHCKVNFSTNLGDCLNLVIKYYMLKDLWSITCVVMIPVYLHTEMRSARFWSSSFFGYTFRFYLLRTLEILHGLIHFFNIQACDIKDPTQNIEWTVPEGGGGPGYSVM